MKHLTDFISVASDVAVFHWSQIASSLAKTPSLAALEFGHLKSTATSYQQWHDASASLEAIEGRHEWRATAESTIYDYKLVASTLADLRQARETGDRVPELLQRCLFRNFGGIATAELYGTCETGTKILVEDFLAEVKRSLYTACSAIELESGTEAARDWLLAARQTYGRSALLLSGGGTLALYHVGLTKCLWENGLLPRIISGASGGSIVASFAGTHTFDEFDRLFKPSFCGNLKFVTNDGSMGFLSALSKLFKEGVAYDVNILSQTLITHYGDITFAEAYEKTNVVLNISVTSSSIHEMHKVLNFVNAPNVVIRTAVVASCSVPIIFPASEILEKNAHGQLVHWGLPGCKWIDGSVQTDLPVTVLSEMFNVNHFIVSQVNPHIAPFLSNDLVKSPLRRAAEFFYTLATNEFSLRCNQLEELDLLPCALHRVRSVISQTYVGDVTIIPSIPHSNYLKILTNPTPHAFIECLLTSERAAWPKIAIIKDHMAIELALDKLIARMQPIK